MKTTLLDYPGKVASTIFLSGCNFRCPYCHNMDLAKGIEEPLYTEDEMLGFLKKRQGIIDGVCISGGEPCINRDLPGFLRRIKETGLLIKLDTNGTFPEMLSELINEGLIDYAAMDIKGAPSDYPLISGTASPGIERIKESIGLLLNGSLPYEFRTTVIKQYHNRETFDRIGELIRGCPSYYLQSFRDSEAVIDHTLSAMDKEELLEITKQLEKYDIKAFIRGVD